MLLNCVVGEDTWESLGLQGDPTSPSWRRSVLGVHLKDWCWSWNSSTLATSCEELTHLKRPWCWEGLGAEGEGGDRGWDDWMASPTGWAWVWVNFGSWWWTGRPGMLQFMGSQRVRHNWVTELNCLSISYLYLSTHTHTHPTPTHLIAWQIVDPHSLINSFHLISLTSFLPSWSHCIPFSSAKLNLFSPIPSWFISKTAFCLYSLLRLSLPFSPLSFHLLPPFFLLASH